MFPSRMMLGMASAAITRLINTPIRVGGPPKPPENESRQARRKRERDQAKRDRARGYEK